MSEASSIMDTVVSNVKIEKTWVFFNIFRFL